MTVFWVLCYLQGKVLIHDKDSSRHFQICPSVWPLFCLLRLSWTNISAMTLCPAAPDSPSHALSWMVFQLTFCYLVFPTDSEQEHMSENNDATYMTRFPLKYQHATMYTVGSQERLITLRLKTITCQAHFPPTLLERFGATTLCIYFLYRKNGLSFWLFFQLSYRGTVAAGTRNVIFGLEGTPEIRI